MSAAHFSPRLSRRNSLRKKISESPQVRPSPSPPLLELKNSNLTPDVVEDSISNSVSDDVSFMGFDPSSVEDSKSESTSKLVGGNVLFNKLDNWVSQYKKEVEFWGLGSAPIFTVFQDSDGRVENVTVHLDEISRRSGQRFADPTALNSKISHARFLAREMENGRYVLPKNSSIAKFVASGEKSSFFSGIKSLNQSLQHANLFPKLSRIVIVLLCGSLVFWATKKSLMGREDEKKQLTQLEREMLRRKMKARMERESLEKGSVEVIQESTTVMSTGRPQIDKDVLMSRISKTKALEKKVELSDSFQYQTTESLNLETKVQEIREMARHAKEIESANKSTADKHRQENQDKKKEMLNEIGNLNVESNFPDGESKEKRNTNGLPKPEFLQDPKSDVFGSFNDATFMEKGILQASTSSNNEFIDVRKTSFEDIKESDAPLCSTEESIKNNQGSLTLNDGLPSLEKTTRKKTRIIWSVKEARDYLSEKQKKLEKEKPEPDQELQKNTNIKLLRDDGSDSDTKMDMDRDFGVESDFTATTIASEHSVLEGRQSISSKIDDLEDSKKETGASFGQVSTSEVNGNDSETKSSMNKGNMMESNFEEFKSMVEKIDNLEDKETGAFVVQPSHCEVSSNDSKMKSSVKEGNGMENNSEKVKPIIEKIDNLKDGKKETSDTVVRPSNSEVSGSESKMKSFMNKENWMEENFEEFKPIIEKIGVGFRDNYAVARKNVNRELYVNSDIRKLVSEDDDELEWMKDDGLRNIVFQVKENELAGRGPFDSMSAEDKLAFFKGLENEVKKGNEKLLKVHEWIHSNIENIDYGADGISLYDPPEKIFPRWKGPQQVDQDPDFLNNFLEQREALSAKKDKQDSLNKSEESQLNDNNTATSSVLYDPKTRFNEGASKNSNIVIESSDGSVRAGKKSGKEYWQHTKKWSRKFLESYNAESDPEVKSIMKDMGKGLDRWITEKEIAEAADLMNKLPEKRKEFIQKRIDKVKREIELFGPQAVVSKYREYAEEPREDYLWWLDLPYVLCIELYTNHNGDQRIGFYSLEMATDLELTPKPYHVIGFENPGDCKNLCYIIQAHMDMLGNGHAFVIARPPKDAFREAKANGFNVTIIRKGELPLNVDDTLEEVEEKITEIGSKMYHDEIMQERSVDISSLTKGFLGASRPKPRKGSKRRMKRGNKQKRH